MYKRVCILVVLTLAAFGLSGCPKKAPTAVMIDFGSVQGEEKDPELVKATLGDFMESDAVQPFLASNYGFAIFPTIGKAGIGVGGARGKGWVFKGHESTGVTSMTQITIGFQLGGQAYSQVIFFEDQRAYDSFTSGNFEFGAQASAVAITAGANASASTAGGTSAAAGNSQTKANYSMGMAVFTRAKGGLMYEASLGGQKFSFKAYE